MNDLLQAARAIRPVHLSGESAGLPVFRLNDSDSDIYYTPGLVATVPNRWREAFHNLLRGKPLPEAPTQLERASDTILNKAQEAKDKYQNLHTGSFDPECLTLYLHNQCNLECTYCLRVKNRNKKYLSPQTVEVAAKLVAESCRKKGKLFTTVFHGWGEPTYDFSFLDSLVRVVNGEARKAKCPLYRYIATNGVLSPEVATYLANHFDLIGLSCDGPPDIQNRRRPLANSRESSKFVERTASILRKNRARYSVRTTITRADINRQEEIADYILRRLHPAEMYFEPAYRTKEGFKAEDAEEFLKHYLKAARLTSNHGVPLAFSGCRMFEVHGPYCNIFRNVLNVTPENEATACFAAETAGNGFTIGKAKDGTFQIYSQKIRRLQTELAYFPDECNHCFNRFHCVGTCPEQCNSDGCNNGNRMNTFRCRLQLMFGVHQILIHARESLTDDGPNLLVSIKEIKPTNLHVSPQVKGGNPL